jgi:flagellar FliL protein
MAEENKTGAEKKTSNLIIIGLFAFLITVVVSATFLVFMLKNSSSRTEPGPQATGGYKEELGPLVPLGSEVIVNIASESGAQHYLKVNLALEVRANSGKNGKDEAEKVTEEVTRRIPQIRDVVITVLRAKTKEKIDQKEGKDLIRSEIINNVNKFLISGAIKNVYFQDFVIQ